MIFSVHVVLVAVTLGINHIWGFKVHFPVCYLDPNNHWGAVPRVCPLPVKPGL